MTQIQPLTPSQREALAAIASIGKFSAYVPTPERRGDFHTLVALGLARSSGHGLGGEGFAPTPAGRQAFKRDQISAGPQKKARGFALLSPERRREISSLGGKSVAPHKRTFAADRTLAAQAGREGGEVKPGKAPHGR